MTWDPFRSARDLGRLYTLASILIDYGFADLVRRVGLSDFLQRAGKALRWQKPEAFHEMDTPQRLRKALEKMGPTFVKIGQVLATRVDLFPPEYIREFERLQSHVPPVDFEEIRPQLEEDLGEAPERIFSRFETEAFAAASMAQVHRAKTHDGEPVIIKVLRPGIRPQVESDLRLLRHLAERVESDVPALKPYRPKALMDQIAASLERELDLVNECRNAERARRGFRKDSIFVVPEVHWEWTSQRVNVQSMVEGIPGHDVQALREAGVDAVQIARRGAEEIARTVLEDGFFHADPHPGNMYFLPGGRVALVDWGMTGRLTPERRREIVDLLKGFVDRDVSSIVELLLTWSDEDSELDRDSLTRDVAEHVDRYHGVKLDQVDLAEVFGDITAMLRRHRLALPADMAMVIKVFVTLESLGRSMDPDFDLVEHLQPLLKRLWLRRFAPDVLARRGWQAATDLLEVVSDLPKDLQSILRAMRRGTLKHEMEIENLDEFTRTLDRAASRLSVSFVTSALIVGACIAIASGEGLKFFGLPVFEMLAFGAVLGGLWVLWSIWRS